MSLDSLPTVITLLIALSVAAERVVEIIKSLFRWLDEAHENPREEGFRRAALHALAALSGIIISWLAWPIVAQVLTPIPDNAIGPRISTVFALGLLASGGSGFWNSMLTYVESLKELKRADAQEREAQLKAAAIPTPLEGQLRP
jgi:hypothetical protein